MPKDRARIDWRVPLFAAALDTSFRALRDDVIKNLAKQALAETTTHVTEIALKLGYSELSSFDRTFRRMTGMTPRGYREKALSQSP